MKCQDCKADTAESGYCVMCGKYNEEKPDELHLKILGIRKAAQGHLDIIAGQKNHLDQVDIDLLLCYVRGFHEELLQIQILEKLQKGV